jgi:phage baseplate assembly protein gpV
MPYGTVTQAKPGFIKAEIPEMEYETDWIPIVSLISKTDKSQYNIPLNTQVYVINEYNSSGELHSQICVGCTYNDQDTAPFSATKDGLKYSDSAEISYDKTSKVLTLKSANQVVLEGITVNLGTNPGQNMVSMTTLDAYLTLANAAMLKIAALSGAEKAALTTALGIFQVGITSIQTPLI